MTKPLDRGDAVNLARNVLGANEALITKTGVRMLAQAVLVMDAELTRLYKQAKVIK